MTEHKGLYDALRAVQAEAPTLPKDKKNPHFKSSYTSLDTVVEVVGPLLQRHGLVWTTRPSGTHDEPTLAYELAHAETGQTIGGAMPLLLDKRNAQGMGSALTYARRYALTAVLNLVADEDDDGTAAARAAAAPEVIGEDDAARLVAALKALTGAGPNDKPAITALWKQLRGSLERPTVAVAQAVYAIEQQRASLNADPEAERLRDDARRGYEAICKVTPGGAAIEYFIAQFNADLAQAGHDPEKLREFIKLLEARYADAQAATRAAA